MSKDKNSESKYWIVNQLAKFELSKIITPMRFAMVLVLLFCGGLFQHHIAGKNSGMKLDLIGTLERTLYDARFRMRGEIPTSGTVGILAIDEKSIAKFGRWPFPRSVYEPALQNLKKAGVQWIGFDTIYSEPERPYLDESVEGIQKALFAALEKGSFNEEAFSNEFGTLMESSKGDLSFAKGIAEYKNIVQGFFYNETIGDAADYDWASHQKRLIPSAIDFVSFANSKKLSDFPDIIMPGGFTNTQVIAGNNPTMGFFNNQSDTDGIVRQATLVRGIQALDGEKKPIGEPILVPSLSLQLASKYLGREIMVKFDAAGVSQIDLMDPTGKTKPINIPLSAGGEGRMKLNHYGRGGSFPMVSLADAYDNVLTGTLPKVLIAGSVTTGIADLRPSPFGENFNGVEHHVATLENVITKNFLKRPDWALFAELGMLVATGILFASLLTKASAAMCLGIMVAFCVVTFYADKYFLWGKGYWFYLGTIYVQNISLFFGVTLLKYFGEEKEKRKVKNAFQHYLNPAVINQLMANPDQLKLGGDKKELTVFFSDVRGFTTLSETLSPEALTQLLNEYFTPMTDIILESGGLLDKYIGDAIMAVWGAPLICDDHPDRALTASLRMLDSLDSLRANWKEKGQPLIDIGCGLNTGNMVVGNMGSNQRFDYTVLGDSVNLGARLEGITKEYGVKIICSEFTKKALKNPQNFMLRELDDIRVKGKNEPVKIFEAMRPLAGKIQMQQDLMGIFSEGLAFYRLQEWEKAQEKFVNALKLFPNDGPAEEFLERCQYLKENSPGAEWNGVWVMKTK